MVSQVSNACSCKNAFLDQTERLKVSHRVLYVLEVNILSNLEKQFSIFMPVPPWCERKYSNDVKIKDKNI